MFGVDVARKEQGILLLAPGYLGLAYAELDDVLFDLNIVASADFGLYGVLVFLLAYSFFVSSRYASTYSRLEQLSQARGAAGKLPSLAGITAMLDSLEEAVVAVKQSGDICFCNKAFAALTGFDCSHFKGRSLSDVLESPQGPASRALLEAVQGEGPPSGKARAFQNMRLAQRGQSIAVNFLLTGLDLADEHMLLMLVRKSDKTDNGGSRKPGGQTAPVSATMLRQLNANRQRILQLEEAVVSLEKGGEKGRTAVLEDLKALDELLRRLGTWLTANDKSGERRRQAVAVMRLALDCWTAAGHGGKVELAEQSRIWNVYQEKDGYCRTQTLDKYLDIATLPSRPRWRDIHATAEFVLANCDADISVCQRLAKALAELQAIS
jgi:two-component system sensor histidine kinase ChiS